MLKPLLHPPFVLVRKVLRHVVVHRLVDHLFLREVEDVLAGSCDVGDNPHFVLVEDDLEDAGLAGVQELLEVLLCDGL